MSNPTTCACEEHTHAVAEKIDGTHVLVCTECGTEHRTPCPPFTSGRGRTRAAGFGGADVLFLVGMFGALVRLTLASWREICRAP